MKKEREREVEINRLSREVHDEGLKERGGAGENEGGGRERVALG